MKHRTRPIVLAAVLAAPLALSCLPSRAGAASPGWIAGTPLSPTGQFAGISCTSRSSCWAVGLTNPRQQGSQLETVHWNGAVWTSVPSPIARHDLSAGQPPNGVSSFTCVGKNSCWAVGSTARRDLILHWNGHTWSVAYSSGWETLLGVTCVSAGDCWAVGTYLAHTGAYGGPRGTWFGVILHRTGHGWSSVPFPNPRRVAAESGCTLPGGLSCYSNRLVSVACASARLCWTAGAFRVQGQQGQSSPKDASYILRWNGVRWSIARAPIPTGDLTTVRCSSRTSCWALGSSWVSGQPYPHLVALSWKGTRWSLVPADTVPARGGVASMSCRSTADCWVVGGFRFGWGGSTPNPTAVHWNGRTWSDRVATLPAGAFLLAVSVPTANDGWAAGQDGDGSQDIFHWNGTDWSALRQQAVGGAPGQ